MYKLRYREVRMSLSGKFGKNREKAVFKRITGLERLTIFALALLDQSLVFNILVAYFAIEPRPANENKERNILLLVLSCASRKRKKRDH